ncbi:MAG: FAD-dependent monooxygenase, partial [Chloroflexi bacterium]|nr:FAD-dependent monooxygenase [Chloroflexota bacterium]
MQVDAVIVGARVAGASLALQLGQQGRQVILVDRARFPSDTLSTHLALSSTVAALDRLGVLADVEAAGLRRMTRMRTTVEDCVVEGPVMPADGKDYALAPRRSHLDHVLLTHAVRHPTVELRQGTTVEGIVWEGNRAAGVKTRTPNGQALLRPPAQEEASELCEFPQVTQPALVLWAEEDTALLPGNLEGLEAWVQQLEIVRIPGSSHWVLHEQPEVVSAAIQ